MSQTWGFCNSKALLSQVSRGKYECVSTRRKDFNTLKKLVLWKIKTKQNTKMLEWVLKRVIQSRHWSHLLNEWEASINHWVLMKERSTTASRHCFGGHVFFYQCADTRACEPRLVRVRRVNIYINNNTEGKRKNMDDVGPTLEAEVVSNETRTSGAYNEK